MIERWEKRRRAGLQYPNQTDVAQLKQRISRYGDARLKASADFTHFDVPDFNDVIPQTYEMVEKALVTDRDFSEFTFGNAARLHTRNNPDFFRGTVVEQAAAAELGLKTAAPAAVA